MFKRNFWVLLAVLSLALPSLTFSANGPGGGPPSNGGGPGNGGGQGGGKHEETAGNNLSYPAVATDQSGASAFWNVPAGTLGVDYSYGCDLPDGTYPNTSCVRVDEELLLYLTADECVESGAPCAGFEAQELDRIYWQKVAQNDWSAETVGPRTEARTPIARLDWGDNLETQSWTTRSSIRIEATPYATVDPVLTGFQMWHVYGQGPDEKWGVRVQEGSALPFVYASPYAIVNTPHARLNLAKIQAAGAGLGECPTFPKPSGEYSWNFSDTGEWTGADPGDEICTLHDIDFSPELNVGGKYVYGYNWKPKNEVLCPGFQKSGWWRLTFYSDQSPGITSGFNFTAGGDAEFFSPPAMPDALPAEVLEAEEGPPLYEAVHDVPNNLVYIDICIEESARGGGRP